MSDQEISEDILALQDRYRLQSRTKIEFHVAPEIYTNLMELHETISNNKIKIHLMENEIILLNKEIKNTKKLMHIEQKNLKKSITKKTQKSWLSCTKK